MLKTEILYGIHPVFEALKASRRDVVEVYISPEKDSKRFGRIIITAEKLKIPVKKTSSAKLSALAETDMHQGVAARVGPYPYVAFSDIMERRYSGDPPLLLLLDHILDPQNLGAIIRTALCVGADGIIIPKDRSAKPTPAVSKSSAGALEHVLLGRVTNMVTTIKALKKKGMWIVGLDRSGGKPLFSVDLADPVGIVIGGEERGIRPLVKKHCDVLVSIPQTGRFNSLNASTAAAVAMYEVFRQRKFSAKAVG